MQSPSKTKGMNSLDSFLHPRNYRPNRPPTAVPLFPASHAKVVIVSILHSAKKGNPGFGSPARRPFKPMKSRISRRSRTRGFALVITLSMMILLTVLSVGLLSLGTISIRSSASGEADARALANARLAVVLAIGQLQKEAGDDRRVTADASILGKAGQGNLVGVWSSWSPGLAKTPDGTAPDYTKQKTDLFRTWLVSSPESVDLTDRQWAETAADPNWPRLFSEDRDGFDLSAATVPAEQGAYAWAISQEGSKAKISVPGPESADPGNAALHAQRRPSLALSKLLKQPKDGWDLRAGRLLSTNQVGLDEDLVAGPGMATGGSYTVHSQGLLTDVVNGGLKTDLNLGFEMSDSDFLKASWGDTPNPFRSGSSGSGAPSPGSYQGERALFRPLVENPIVSITTDYSPASVAHRFYAAAVPTFDHLRSFYRIPHHLYGGTTPVVAERGPDHIAVKVPSASGGAFFGPSKPPEGRSSTLGVRPVLNRLVYLLSATLAGDGQVQLALTPVISLWNPYNTTLEIDGAVAYPWMDLPFQLAWEFKLASGTVGKKEVNMSMMMGKQFEGQAHGRSVNPYFLCEITANGDGDLSEPIRFKPGEVRVFAPASKTPVQFERTGSNAERTVRLRPVDDISQMNTKGGLAIPMSNGVKTGGIAHGFTYVVKQTDKVSLRVRPSQQGAYHYFVSLEDSARIRNKSDTTRGEAISEVQMLGFASSVAEISSPVWSYSELNNTSQPFAVIETFHRTAQQNVGSQAVADLIYTTNPRQAAINHQLAAGSFTVAPHYLSTLRSVSSFDGAIQTTFDGRRSFWGPNHSASGEDRLPFFEIPREPLLSLGGFQHADLASSAFSPANQFGNSWASPYLSRDKAGSINTKYAGSGVPVYDTAYLANEALWDGFFFSGAAPLLKPGTAGSPAIAWNAPIASVGTPLKKVLEDFVADPAAHPLANPRMRLVKGGLAAPALVESLLEPAGCARIAAHLTVDGAFNVNSTDVEAWVSQLSGLRGESFDVEDGKPPAADVTAFPRFRHPTGNENNNWNGFRALGDTELRTLAENLVREVRLRGPFLSLGEFVNRRVERGNLGRSGAIQAAIDAGKLNANSTQAPFSTDKYPTEARENIIPDTGVGIPGYLTQADVLQSLAPVITCRSDTFTVRGYGEATDAAGKVIARRWCEAVVQRMPDFVDPADAADAAIAAVTPVNQAFGRRFEIVSFRVISGSEIL